MKKIALMLMFVIASVIPVSAQQAQPAAQPTQTPISVVDSALFTKATDSITAQDFKAAVLDLSLFILLNPTYSPAYYGRAQSYMGLNDFDHALQDVNLALATAGTAATPDYSATLYTTRGEIDRQQQKPDDALKDFTQAITLAPSEQALAERGLLYAAQNDLPSGLKDLNSAVALDATNPVLYIYRGEINNGLHDSKSTAADYLHFFSLIQPNPTQHAPINSGDVVTLQVDQGVFFIVPFTVKARQYVSALAAARTGSVDPLMVLIDPTGKPLAGDDDSGGNVNALILNYIAPADGQYALVVGHSLGGVTGTVLVQLQITDTPAQ